MILAAGLGQRMRPLTDTLPKPLLSVAGKPLLQYHLEALQRAGIREVVINLAYLGDKIREFVGDGSRFGLQVDYSPEPEPLETGGGVLRALPLLGVAPFLLINGDVWSDYSLERLVKTQLSEQQLGHLVLVPNPEFHPNGDFALRDDGVLIDDQLGLSRYTFAGISVLRPALVADYVRRRDKFPLVEALRAAISGKRLSAEVYEGLWSDVGTPERLLALGQMLE
jgi:MurNAc alpha-1-phosphate uridylyltransferase